MPKRKSPASNKQPPAKRAKQSTVAPAAMSMIYRTPATRISTGERGSVIVRNCEILGDVTIAASGVFSVRTFPLAPFSTTWLSGVAANYSKWLWRKVRVTYIPQCATSTTGRFAMGAMYDPSDLVPDTINPVLQLDKAIMSPVWGGNDESVSIDIDCTKFPRRNYQYITLDNYDAIALEIDRSQYVPAIIQVGTDGGAADAAIGTLMIEYHCELLEPIAANRNF